MFPELELDFKHFARCTQILPESLQATQIYGFRPYLEPRLPAVVHTYQGQLWKAIKHSVHLAFPIQK